jgi:hypothetical protein
LPYHDEILTIMAGMSNAPASWHDDDDMNSTLARLAAVPATAVIVLVGVWVTGGVVTDDEATAKVLTGVWFAAAGGIAALVAVRWRSLLLPVLATWLVTSGAAGGYLLATATRTRRRRPRRAAPAPAPRPPPGRSRSRAATSGTASIRRPAPRR